MVQLCRERGLDAEAGDLFELLAGLPAESLAGVVSFHVIEHLPGGALDRLVRLAYRALRPGGVLILETPNPLSMVVAARNFWLDPTHVRPVHPESLRLIYELAGFEPVERLDLRPFPTADRLPEIDLAPLPAEQRPLADGVEPPARPVWTSCCSGSRISGWWGGSRRARACFMARGLRGVLPFEARPAPPHKPAEGVDSSPNRKCP